jgi:hypothetical protein
MGNMNIAGKAVSDTDRCDKVESEQRKVCQVILGKRLFL